MKMTPAFLLLIASALTSQAALSTPVTFEHWTCTGAGNGEVESLEVTVDQQGRSAVGYVNDSSVRSTGIEVRASDALYELSGSYYGRNSAQYSIQLSPVGLDFSANSTSLKGTGTAKVGFNSYIDCHDQVSTVETLTCEVQFKRQ
jgi:hypothetical protein